MFFNVIGSPWFIIPLAIIGIIGSFWMTKTRKGMNENPYNFMPWAYPEAPMFISLPISILYLILGLTRI
jgi:hypothetical protein